MRRICKNCVSFNRETCVCGDDGAEVDPESRPRLNDGFCFNPRTPSTGSERTKICSENGRKGGLAPHVRRGRKPDPNRLPRIQIQARKIDRDVFFEYGKLNNMTIGDVLHYLARVIVQNHPNIPKPKGWIDEL